MAAPDLKISSNWETMVFPSGPVVPGFTHAVAIQRAILQIREHLGWRNGLKLNVLIGIDRIGGQPVAQQEVVHRSRVHNPHGVGLSVGSQQVIAVIRHGANPLIGQPLGQGDAIAIPADRQRCDDGRGIATMATGRHPGRHPRGHQGCIQGAIEQTIGHPAPAGFTHQLHRIQPMLGKEALGFSHR